MRIDRVNVLRQQVLGQQALFKAVNHKSDSATKISFLISEALAKKGKPLLDGELVKECLEIFVDVACPDKKSLVDIISLSHQTIGRRIDDLAGNIQDCLVSRLSRCEFFSLCLDESTDINDTAQLVIFVRGVTSDFEVIEEFLDLCPMKGTTTGADIFREVNAVMTKVNLSKEKLCGITTDGAPAMIGRHSGFVALLTKSVSQQITAYHCILHQEQLCAKTLHLKTVMENVVSCINFIRSSGLNHRQFQSFLKECDIENGDVIYFSPVRWLSRAATLARFWQLRNEIKIFLDSKKKDVSFLLDDLWLNDLAFLVDITRYLADLNVKLQGKKQFVNTMFEQVSAFMLKLELLKNHMVQRKLVHFSTLTTRPSATVDYEKYSDMLSTLIADFSDRFLDFKKNSQQLRIFGNPFSADPTTAPDTFQMELIYIQTQEELKSAFTKTDLPNFYGKYVSKDSFPMLRELALKQSSLFGSTYSCEQFFSKMKHVKCDSRSLLSDEHLMGILKISTSSVGADIDQLCKAKQCQISH